MIKTAQQNYFKVTIEENKKDYKAIFNIANSLLFRKQDSPLLIRTAPSKHCKLDPLPINIMKEHMDVLAYYIAKIVNISFDTGYFSDELKEGILCPLIENIKLELFTNFRPVLNLSYLSKLIERLVCKQLVRYTNSTGQMEPCQSACREYSSTETALLKIKADILDAMDKKEIMCLVMLDISAAFNTISHELLLKRLKYRFGIMDLELSWIESFLTNRTQCVSVSTKDRMATSSKRLLK